MPWLHCNGKAEQKRTSMTEITIAAAVMKSDLTSIENNILKVKDLSEKASLKGAEIICFPELNLSGYFLNNDNQKYSHRVPGKISEDIGAIAEKYNITILCGLIEEFEKKYYITHIAVSPEGLIGKYRKLHLSPQEKKYYSPGNDLPVFELKGIRFAIGLCYDAHFPELSTIYALNKADIIFFPHASPPSETADEKKLRWLRYLSARAYDNSIYVAACNQLGETQSGGFFTGNAMILDPKGKIISEKSNNEEGILIGIIKNETLERVRNSRMGFFMADRRPDLYEDILKDIE